MAYRRVKYLKTGIISKGSVEGETIEMKTERIVANGEPIKDGAPIVYTERKDGVNAAHNIRTDRFEVAAEAMDAVEGSYKAKREARGISKDDIVKGKDVDKDVDKGGSIENASSESEA